jgi:predicted phosphodiesterase
MKLHILSDTHLEYFKEEQFTSFFNKIKSLQKTSPAATLILAGDVCQFSLTKTWNNNMKKIISYYENTIYVAGNHEYFDLNINETNDSILNFSQQQKGFHFLNNSSVEIEGQRFIGGTMWYPNSYDSMFKWNMPDFRLIKDFEPEVYENHESFIKNVVSQLDKNDIVVSHHLPLESSIAPQFKNSPLNQFFVTDISNMLSKETLPKMWIHGHTHCPMDYTHELHGNEMRVFCNPLGYPKEFGNETVWDRICISI